MSDSFGQFSQLPLDVRCSIDRLCMQFESAWRSGSEPTLEQYIVQLPGAHHAALLTELIALDLEYRRQRGESPTEDSYVGRWPDLATVVRNAFARLRAPNVSLDASLPTLGQAETLSSPSETPPDIPGFRVLDVLGHGGMGVVYRARQEALGREVALKMIQSRGKLHLQERVRFRLEAEAVARLSHPNIVQVYDCGEHDWQPYLVLELVQGGSLKQLTGSPLPPRESAELVETLARAIHHAHCRGIVHRDLKPANVLLAPVGQAALLVRSDAKDKQGCLPYVPKITDFGLAKDLAVEAWQTQEGDILGTPAYMAPEQAGSGHGPIGPPADVYALGSILFELLTGRLPFEARDAIEMLLKVQFQEPTAPSRLVPGLPHDLDIISLKCLQKEPARRYATAQELADDLRRFLGGEPIHARPVGRIERLRMWGRRNPLPAALAGLTGALVLTVAIISTLAAARLGRERDALVLAERQRSLALIDGVLSAAPDGVPYLLQALRSCDRVVPLLVERFERDRQESVAKLRAAVALAALGHPHADFLLDAVLAAPASEGGNLALAFRAMAGDGIAERLDQRAREDRVLTAQVRYAILLLDLGDARAAARLLAQSANAGPRSAFIEAIRDWHGDLAAVPTILQETADESLRSGLCAAVGRVPRTSLATEVCLALRDTLRGLYLEAPDGGTHNAARWALREWGFPLPPLRPTRDPVGRKRWYVNSSGMTMIAVPTGAFVRGADATVVSRPYLLADREVTVAQFNTFMEDPKTPNEKKPIRWTGPDRTISPLGDSPVNRVPREGALLFCNWLSAREGRTPCYRQSQARGGWDCDLDADGYRLPTEAEWDHAHRAEADGLFFFGNEPRWLTLFSHINDVRMVAGGGKLPNRWGLFDMVGNAWESCWDEYRRDLSRGVQMNPVYPSVAGNVSRGGAYDSGSYHCRIDQRLPSSGGHSTSFRVARTAGPPRTGLAQAAIDACTRGLELHPKHVNLLQKRCELLAGARRWKEAVADFARLLKLAPNEPASSAAAITLLVKLGDEARRQLRDAMK